MTLQAIDSKSPTIHAQLFHANQDPIPVASLIDSRCSARAFADQQLIQRYGIPTEKLPTPRVLILADGKSTNTVTDYFICPVAMGDHIEWCFFFVTCLSKDTPVIFGMPWLQRHNPSIDWRAMTLTFDSQYCLKHCCSTPCTAPRISRTVTHPPRCGYVTPGSCQLPRHHMTPLLCTTSLNPPGVKIRVTCSDASRQSEVTDFGRLMIGIG